MLKSMHHNKWSSPTLIKEYHKEIFMCVTNLCKFVKTGLLINLWFLFMLSIQHFMHSNIWHNKKFMLYKFMRPMLDSHIIRINKSRAEICYFTVCIIVKWHFYQRENGPLDKFIFMRSSHKCWKLLSSLLSHDAYLVTNIRAW